MHKDEFGQELMPGDSIAYVTARSGWRRVHHGTILELGENGRMKVSTGGSRGWAILSEAPVFKRPANTGAAARHP